MFLKRAEQDIENRIIHSLKLKKDIHLNSGLKVYMQVTPQGEKVKNLNGDVSVLVLTDREVLRNISIQDFQTLEVLNGDVFRFPDQIVQPDF